MLWKMFWNRTTAWHKWIWRALTSWSPSTSRTKWCSIFSPRIVRFNSHAYHSAYCVPWCGSFYQDPLASNISAQRARDPASSIQHPGHGEHFMITNKTIDMWDWAFWKVITEWLRPWSGWMVFWIIWSRWSHRYYIAYGLVRRQYNIYGEVECINGPSHPHQAIDIHLYTTNSLFKGQGWNTCLSFYIRD